MGFGDGIKGWGNEALEWVDQEVTEVAQKFFTTIVDYSPTKFIGARYAEGVFVNSWYTGINNFDPTIGAAPDMSGSGSRQRISALKGSKAFYKQDGYVSLSNNLDYSANVEYLGWQRTGPYAPVRNAITYMEGANKL